MTVCISEIIRKIGQHFQQYPFIHGGSGVIIQINFHRKIISEITEKSLLTFVRMLGKITKAHGLLHFIVFIWGWSPILGRAIDAQALQLVWFRILITLLALIVYFIFIRENLKTDGKTALILAGIGGVISFHWFCFYNGIKVSNVSVTLVGFSTGTIFTSLIEPFFYKRKIILYELFFGAVIIFAIGLIMWEDLTRVNTPDSEPKTKVDFGLGIFYGALAAFTSSLFTVWNGMLVRKVKSTMITFYELSGGIVCLSVFLLLNGNFTGKENFFSISSHDYFYLGILAVVGTAFPFIASTNLLKKISPYTMTLTVNLETVYGILLAAILFKEYEQLTGLFYFSTCLILLVIVGNAAFKNHLENKKAHQKN